jgi:Pyruvate/2-oxoacid:ferredoxin oxidoreductase delta subunit/coenzyme F420-reducing hydrogenase delta subunit
VPFTVPLWWRPRLTFRQAGQRHAPAPAWVNQDLCTGCTQCYLDCPYQAITMVTAPETNTASELVAEVNPSLCTACGICAGSCAPMVVGPPGRRGRDLLMDMQRFFEREQIATDEVVALVCGQSAGSALLEDPPAGVHVYGLHCAGASHTSAMEHLLRRGVGGVYVLSCPSRDCFYRRGPHWLHERIHEDREAELHARVDRRRIRIGYFSRADEAAARADLTAFRSAAAAAAEHVVDEGQIDLNTLCETMQEAV